MSLAITSPVTGGTQTGLTSPTYTLVAGTAPDLRSVQSNVTALGGTQTNVVVHSINKPFTITRRWPAMWRRLSEAVYVATSGLYGKIPVNEVVQRTRKGVNITANQVGIMEIVTTIRIPAGAEAYDEINCRACASAHFGSINGNSSAILDTCVTGIS